MDSYLGIVLAELAVVGGDVADLCPVVDEERAAPGKLDLKPVRDIRIGFKTYSTAGN